MYRAPPHLDEMVASIKSKAARFVSWGDIGTLWNESPADAVELWKALRLEARDEFISGHYGARAFEVAEYMHEVWKRAQYLAIRDGLVAEWKPRGASEFILIDTMVQSYVMQLEWTEKAMLRMQTVPQAETDEFYRHKEMCGYRGKQWDNGRWSRPTMREAEAVEQAFRMAEMCRKAYQRAVRQLANLRLMRAKTSRLKRRERMKMGKGIRVA